MEEKLLNCRQESRSTIFFSLDPVPENMSSCLEEVVKEYIAKSLENSSQFVSEWYLPRNSNADAEKTISYKILKYWKITMLVFEMETCHLKIYNLLRLVTFTHHNEKSCCFYIKRIFSFILWMSNKWIMNNWFLYGSFIRNNVIVLRF